jgi:hypothetical protein
VNTIEANQPALDDYNSAVGLNCQEGAGLNTGSGQGNGNGNGKGNN